MAKKKNEWIRLECVYPHANIKKFYELWLSMADPLWHVYAKYGRIGTPGKEICKTPKPLHYTEALDFLRALREEKEAKGYTIVDYDGKGKPAVIQPTAVILPKKSDLTMVAALCQDETLEEVNYVPKKCPPLSWYLQSDEYAAYWRMPGDPCVIVATKNAVSVILENRDEAPLSKAVSDEIRRHTQSGIFAGYYGKAKGSGARLCIIEALEDGALNLKTNDLEARIRHVREMFKHHLCRTPRLIIPPVYFARSDKESFAQSSPLAQNDGIILRNVGHGYYGHSPLVYVHPSQISSQLSGGDGPDEPEEKTRNIIV